MVAIVPNFRQGGPHIVERWCVVELAAAVQYSIPVIFKVETVQRHDKGHVEYSTKEGELVLRNLADLIDCERAECFVQADYDREMAAIRAGVGVAAVNQMVTVAVKGAMAATAMAVLEVDAAVCGEPETLGNIPREGLVNAIKAAAAAGRMEVLQGLLEDDSLTYFELRDLEGLSFMPPAWGHPEAAAALQARVAQGGPMVM